MPQIKVSHVVSFSSEHSNYPANNLLSKEITNSRWIGEEKGASSNSVVLQLEKSIQITSIHIGNYHSGFIEVLVGRSESPDQKYEVLLVSSSFMSPGDSRNSVNTSSVRTFTFDQLAQSVRDKKWDRIRIVCTQPYNRHVQYGLSFIHFFNSDTATDIKSSSSQVTKQNRFNLKIKDESDEESDSSFKPGELFARMREKFNLSTGAQIRNASSPHNINKDSSSFLVKTSRPTTSQTSNSTRKDKDVEPLSRKRDKIMYIDEDDEADEKIDKIIEKDRNDKAKMKEVEQKAKNRDRTASNSATIHKIEEKKKMEKGTANQVNKEQSKTNVNNGSMTSINQNKVDSLNGKRQMDSQGSSSNKRIRLENSNTSNIVRGPDCLRGVTFVISGYVNPQRSNLRDTALSFGAKYRPDWDLSCTHLICAFPNTPKHQQVMKASKNAAVVTGKWIEECEKEKSHLPWQWFATDPKVRIQRPQSSSVPDSSNSPTDFSDEEIESELKKPNSETNNADSEEDTDDEIEKVLKTKNFKRTFKTNAIMSDNSDATDIEDDIPKKNLQSSTLNDDDSDKTDIEDMSDDKPDKMTHSECNEVNTVKNNEKYLLDTDSDHDVSKKMPHTNCEISLMDHFSGIKFYIDTDAMKGEEEKTLKRYVTAYGGDIVKAWPNDHIDVAITTEKHVHKLRPFKSKKCRFIKPEWVWQCNDESMLLSYQNYEIR